MNQLLDISAELECDRRLDPRTKKYLQAIIQAIGCLSIKCDVEPPSPVESVESHSPVEAEVASSPAPPEVQEEVSSSIDIPPVESAPVAEVPPVPEPLPVEEPPVVPEPQVSQPSGGRFGRRA